MCRFWLNKLMFLCKTDLLKLQLSPSASHFSLSLLLLFVLSVCSASNKLFACSTFELSLLFSLLSLTSVSCFGALLLFPPRLSEPLQRYLPLYTCLFCSATSSFSSSVREGLQSSAALYQEPFSAFIACRWQQTRDLRSIGLLSATVGSL